MNLRSVRCSKWRWGSLCQTRTCESPQEGVRDDWHHTTFCQAWRPFNCRQHPSMSANLRMGHVMVHQESSSSHEPASARVSVRVFRRGTSDRPINRAFGNKDSRPKSWRTTVFWPRKAFWTISLTACPDPSVSEWLP